MSVYLYIHKTYKNLNMKNLKYLFSGLILNLLYQSCLKDRCTEQREFIQYTPVYMTKAQFRKNVEATVTRKLENPGKMYFYKQYLFTNTFFVN